MLKILVTGSKGFVGKHLVRRLIQSYNIIEYDLVDGDDIRDKYKLSKLFEKEHFDLVINLAARAGVQSGEEFYEEYYSTNCVGLMNIIRCCEKYKTKKLIHFSSSAALKALSIYGITKLAGDYMLRNCKIPHTLIRPYTIIGEDSRKDMLVGTWREQYKRGEKITFRGDGTTFRGYTYIGDLVDGIVKAIDGKCGEYNLGGNQKITLEEFWTIFKEVYPDAEREFVPLPEWDEPGEIADISETTKILGWKPATNIRKKIKELLQ